VPPGVAMTALRSSHKGVYRAGNLALDVESHQAWLDDCALSLTTQEFELLLMLMRSQNVIVAHETLCNSLWGSSGPRQQKRLGVAVSNLREKLYGLLRYELQSVRSRGYGLVPINPDGTEN